MNILMAEIIAVESLSLFLNTLLWDFSNLNLTSYFFVWMNKISFWISQKKNQNCYKISCQRGGGGVFLDIFSSCYSHICMMQTAPNSLHCFAAHFMEKKYILSIKNCQCKTICKTKFIFSGLLVAAPPQ